MKGVCSTEKHVGNLFHRLRQGLLICFRRIGATLPSSDKLISFRTMVYVHGPAGQHLAVCNIQYPDGRAVCASRDVSRLSRGRLQARLSNVQGDHTSRLSPKLACAAVPVLQGWVEFEGSQWSFDAKGANIWSQNRASSSCTEQWRWRW